VTTAAVFFDLDDTLLDDIGAQAVYLTQLFDAWRAHLPHADVAGFCAAWRAALDHHFDRHLRGELSFPEQRRERIRDVFQAPLGDDDCDARAREFLAAYEASWRLFDDVIPALDALADRPLGVITNGLDLQQRDKLARTGIVDRFRVIVTSDASKLSKPDPRIFHHAAAAIGARPERCVHVGDDWRRDVEGATAAGFRAIWLDRERSRGSSDPPMCGSVTTIESLLNLVGQV
jgi:putative hydrolase of the HAD superfamily